MSEKNACSRCFLRTSSKDVSRRRKTCFVTIFSPYANWELLWPLSIGGYKKHQWWWKKFLFLIKNEAFASERMCILIFFSQKMKSVGVNLCDESNFVVWTNCLLKKDLILHEILYTNINKNIENCNDIGMFVNRKYYVCHFISTRRIMKWNEILWML